MNIFIIFGINLGNKGKFVTKQYYKSTTNKCFKVRPRTTLPILSQNNNNNNKQGKISNAYVKKAKRPLIIDN